MEAFPKSVSRNAVTAPKTFQAPSFGHDYRQAIKSQHYRDHSAIPELHTATVVQPATKLYPDQHAAAPFTNTPANTKSAKLHPYDRSKRSVSFVNARTSGKKNSAPDTTDTSLVRNRSQQNSIDMNSGMTKSTEDYLNRRLDGDFQDLHISSTTPVSNTNQDPQNIWPPSYLPYQQFGSQQFNQSSPFPSVPSPWFPQSNQYASIGQLEHNMNPNPNQNANTYQMSPLYLYPLPFQPIQPDQLPPYQHQQPQQPHQQVPMLMQSVGPVQPQVAIVATDPATLRALLTGTLPTQQLFPPFNVPRQPSPYDYRQQEFYTHGQPLEQFTRTQMTTQSCMPHSLPVPPLYTPKKPCNGECEEQAFGKMAISKEQREDESPGTEKEWIQTVGAKSYNRDGTNAPSAQPARRKSQPDIVVQSRHTTKPSTMDDITLRRDHEEVKSNVWHPPRTLRHRTQPESQEKSLFQEENKHNLPTVPTYREPKKLNPEAFITPKISEGQSKTDTVECATHKAKEYLTIGVIPEPNSISAYYERLKKRAARPLSVYRPKSTFIDDRCGVGKIMTPKPIRQNTVADFESNRDHRAPLQRAVTFGSEQSPQKFESERDNEFKRTVKDPTIMSVAERARRWIEGRQRDIHDRNRYSTCSFIDQDLMDCPDIVTVEDRVRMFDNVTTECRKLDDQIPIKLKPDKPNVSEKSKLDFAGKGESCAITPGRAVASVHLRPVENQPKDWQAHHKKNFTPDIEKPAVLGKNGNTVGTGVNERDELSSMTVGQKRMLFSQEQQARPFTGRPTFRRKTQPVTLDDLARANELIVARLDGKDLDSLLGSVKEDGNESYGFQERFSELSSPEASVLSL